MVSDANQDTASLTLLTAARKANAQSDWAGLCIADTGGSTKPERGADISWPPRAPFLISEPMFSGCRCSQCVGPTSLTGSAHTKSCALVPALRLTYERNLVAAHNVRAVCVAFALRSERSESLYRATERRPLMRGGGCCGSCSEQQSSSQWGCNQYAADEVMHLVSIHILLPPSFIRIGCPKKWRTKDPSVANRSKHEGRKR